LAAHAALQLGYLADRGHRHIALALPDADAPLALCVCVSPARRPTVSVWRRCLSSWCRIPAPWGRRRSRRGSRSILR
jgi:hypothetical protein